MGTKTANIDPKTEKRDFQSLLERLSDLNHRADQVLVLAQEKADELMGIQTKGEPGEPPEAQEGILGACFWQADRIGIQLGEISDQLIRL
ncbi:hypothetical protein LCGC14_0883810 [marine sediment metagenome]|uniref:Uncharacterized protein n=1 Tax=marine sediment metagenome TaxID=412755 RepID=A0A0F9S854_9ZZZZ